MATSSGNIKWVIEVYTEASPDPVIESASIPGLPNINIATSSVSAESKKKLINKLKKVYIGEGGIPEATLSDPAVISYGITSIAMVRDKKMPDSSCSINVVGSIPTTIAPGSWIVVSSFSGGHKDVPSDEGDIVPIVKFVGQIETVAMTYSVQGDGALVKNAVVVVKEWSKVLMSAFRYDALSVYGSVINDSAGKEDIAVSTAAGATTPAVQGPMTEEAAIKAQAKAIGDLFVQAMDPFEFTHAILTIMGMMAQADSAGYSAEKTIADKIASIGLFEMTPPKIPTMLLKRLGITDDGSAGAFPASDFQKGFMKTVTGVQTTPKFNNGQWDGTFDKGSFSIDQYANLLKEGYIGRTNRFLAASPMVNSQSGSSAWDLINSYGERFLNEYYTDLWYEVNGDEIKTQPVLVSRDMPFTSNWILQSNEFSNEYSYFGKSSLQKTADGAFSKIPLPIVDAVKEEWTQYDNLPRIKVDNSSILNFTISNTSLTSPNYFILEMNNGVFDKETGTSLALAFGRNIRRYHMKRFGGQEMAYSVEYYNGTRPKLQDSTEKTSIQNPDIIGQIRLYRELQRMWYSYLYRMPSATLTIKDPNLKISLGFNVQFNFGFFSVVGHVSAYSSTFVVEPDGAETSSLNLHLDRLMIVRSPGFQGASTILRPLPLGGWSKLNDELFAKEMGSVLTP